MKAEASAGAKAYDKELAKIQSFVLDALAPLSMVIDRGNRQETPSPKEYREASLVAAELLGNANARISRLRREKVVADVNKALLPIAQDDDNFRDAPPYLFGNEFAKRSKDYVEQVRAMRSTLPKGTGKRPFFQGGPPRRGGQSRGAEAPTTDSGATGRGIKAPRTTHSRFTGRLSAHTTAGCKVRFKYVVQNYDEMGPDPDNDRRCSSRKAAALHKKLGKGDSRPLGPKYGTGLPIRVQRRTFTMAQTLLPPIQSGSIPADTDGSPSTFKEGRSCGGKAPPTGGVPLHLVSGAQERGWPEASRQPESTELLYQEPTFQTGGDTQIYCNPETG